MAERTGIAWATSTFNPWIGCTKVSPGCDHCYAEVLNRRWGHDRWGVGKPRERTSTANWLEPLKWNRKAQQSNLPWRVFCASLADVFDNEVPPEWLADLFDLIEATPALTWMLLTKRIGNAEEMLSALGLPRDLGRIRLPRNVWLGITTVTQHELVRDLPKSLEISAEVHFLSIEPQLEQMNVEPYVGVGLSLHRIDWVICGGESGHHARPFHADWARLLRDGCRSTRTAFFMKQLGARPNGHGVSMHPPHKEIDFPMMLKDHAGADPTEWPVDLRVQEFPA